jgi:hypothetical protein
MPQMAPVVDNNFPIEMPIDAYQVPNVVPEPAISETVPVINQNPPILIPMQTNQVPTIVPKPRKIKTSFMIIKHNRVPPTVPIWSPYNGPIIIHNQSPYVPPTTVQNELPY